MAKILIARLGALGDILHALPAVTAVREAMPEATIGWLVEERWTELLTARGKKANPDALSSQKPVANLIHTVDTMSWRQQALHPGTLVDMYKARRRVVKVHYDVVLDFQGSMKSAVLARWSGAGRVAGFGEPREPAARFLYSDKYFRKAAHVIDQNFTFASQVLKKYLDGREMMLIPPKLPVDPEAESWARAELDRLGVASFALLNPGAGWGGKQWPAERYGEVARALAQHNLRSLVNVAPGEEALASAVIQAAGDCAFEVRCSIGQLVALTRKARIFLGGDTGPLHLAAALEIPCVGIFGPTDPARTGPYGPKTIALRHPESRTTFSHEPNPDPGLLKISSAEVIYAARHLLGVTHG